MDATPVIADARDALEKLETALTGYKTGYHGEIERAIEGWKKEYDRLAGIEFGEGYVPEINDANAHSAFDYAKDMDASLTQTRVLAAINRRDCAGRVSDCGGGLASGLYAADVARENAGYL